MTKIHARIPAFTCWMTASTGAGLFKFLTSAALLINMGWRDHQLNQCWCDFTFFTSLHSYLHLYIHSCLGLRPGSRLPCGLQTISALRCKALERTIYTVVVFLACWNQCRRTGHRLLSSTTHDLDPRKNSSIYLLDDSVYLTWAGPL